MAAFEYRFKMQGMHKVSAELAGQVCQSLSDSPEGLTAKRLVDVSRDESAPLHAEFEWDDSVAGEKYREEQARKIIQHLIIVRSDIETEREIKLEAKQEQKEIRNEVEEEKPEEENDETTLDRGFVSTGEKDSRFVPLMSALTNDVWRANLLESAKRDSRVFVSKYNRLSELSNIVKEMNDFLST